MMSARKVFEGLALALLSVSLFAGALFAADFNATKKAAECGDAEAQFQLGPSGTTNRPLNGFASPQSRGTSERRTAWGSCMKAAGA